jgi:hypothetical protein
MKWSGGPFQATNAPSLGEGRECQYRYSGIPKPTLEALEAAPSKGRFFDAHIRERFETERLR